MAKKIKRGSLVLPLSLVLSKAQRLKSADSDKEREARMKDLMVEENAKLRAARRNERNKRRYERTMNKPGAKERFLKYLDTTLEGEKRVKALTDQADEKLTRLERDVRNMERQGFSKPEIKRRLAAKRLAKKYHKEDMKAKPKVGVDRDLERAADKIIKSGNDDAKKTAKARRYRENTRARKEALLNPNERIKTVRVERLLKKMAGKAKPKFRAMNSDRTHLKMVSRNTQGALDARKKAKALGKEAGVSIAKARRLKTRQGPITDEAMAKNASARRNMDEAKAFRRYLAYDEGMYHNAPDGKKIPHMRRASKAQEKRIAAGLKPNPIHVTANQREAKAKQDAKLSKDYARKSGGLSSAAKRNAESAIGKIAQAKQYKSAARLGGALGIASMFASHLMGKKEKKRG